MLFYTSDLKEVSLVCDRSVVLFGGQVVAEISAADADEPALLRAAYNLTSDAVIPELVAAEVVAAEAAALHVAAPVDRIAEPPAVADVPRPPTADAGSDDAGASR